MERAFTHVLKALSIMSSGNRLIFLLLEFEISGGIIFREQREGRDRRLTIVTSTGHTFDISRHHRGGYSLHNGGYRKEELPPIYLQLKGFWCAVSSELPTLVLLTLDILVGGAVRESYFKLEAINLSFCLKKIPCKCVFLYYRS